MSTIEIEKMIRYWRSSLSDASRMDISQSKLGQATKLPREEIFSGQMNLETAESFLKNPGNEGTTDKPTADILVCPFVAVPKANRKTGASKNKAVTPLWISARVDESGHITFQKDGIIWIPRDYLEPVSRVSLVLGSVEKLDLFQSLNPLHAEVWSQVLEYSNRMLFEVTGIQMTEAKPGQVLQDPLKDYYVWNEAYVLKDFLFKGTTSSIRAVYNQILEDQEYSPLLQSYASLTEEASQSLFKVREQLSLASLHSGQMNSKFPLSPSQREALHHFLSLQDGEILAVNGPPGTGKTTLLQSIVASLWVNAAIHKTQPPVIVAASANNQAVTNIIESFATTDESSSALSGRWLPTVSSYALYCPSELKEKETRGRYQSLTANGEGFPKTLEDPALITSKIQYYLVRCSQFTEKSCPDVQTATMLLHNKLVQVVTSFQKGIQLFQKYQELTEQISAKYQKYGGVEKFLESKKESLQMEEDVAEKETKRWYSIWTWVRWGGREWTEKRILRKEISEALSITQVVAAIKKEWAQWSISEGIRSGLDGHIDFLNELDTRYRYQAFKLATHYWEGRWLEEVSESTQNGKNMVGYSRNWARYAKVTPCFVSTFFMVPKFFVEEGQPLQTPIDLLIVDEAGQVPPEIAGAAMALSKKAIVVGDTLQIEPVWGITKEVDKGNLLKNGFVSDLSDAQYDAVRIKGITASSGSTMKVAQRASRFQVYEERGMFLREHRRCADPIIAYCNELAYKGKLDPLAPARRTDHPLPYMGYANVQGKMEKKGGSHGNPCEANVIVSWVAKNKQRLLDLYSNTNTQAKQLNEIIGIITPFSWQARLISEKIIELGLGEITVGTVHSLQGAERPIILFSSVYTSDHSGSMFFDQGPNMLNVAVSRAKDSFLVFGDMGIFDKKSQTPSGLLAKFLFSSPDNEIVNVDLPTRPLATKQRGAVRHLISHDSHRQMLVNGIKNSQKRVVIISPFIAREAIIMDQIHDWIHKAVLRGVEVTIYTDSRLNLDSNGNERTACKEGKNLLYSSGAQVKIADRIHNKTLCVDDKILVEGSFNWLSAVRAADHQWHRFETSICYENEDAHSLIQQVLIEMESRVVQK